MTLKGAGLVTASAACIAVTFIASKQAMQTLPIATFTTLWFASASAWGIGFYLWRHGLVFPVALKPVIRPVVGLGLVNGTANLLLFIAINLGDPTLAAFFSRSETIYSVALGALFLGERMRRHQWLGVGIAIGGAGLMTFRAGPVVWQMLGLLLVSNFLLAVSGLMAKQHLGPVSPLSLSTARTVVMSLMMAAIALATGQFRWPGVNTWLWIIGGAFFGPFLSYVLFYKGLLYLDLAKGAVVRATQPLFVALYSLILFGTVITMQQFAGGLLMIAGVVMMLSRKQLST